MSYRALLSLLGSLLLFLSVLLWNRHGLNLPCVNNMDRAYSHLSVAMAERGEAFEGAFSHAGFRHPGPMLFYYLAGAERVLQPWMSAEDSFRTGILFLNTALIGFSIFLLSGLTAHRTYAILLAPLAFVIISPRALFDYWNPYPIPAATCAYLLSLVYFAYGRFWYLPLVCLLGSFIAQCHVSTPPFLVLTFLYAAGACVVARRKEQGTAQGSLAAPLLASVLITLVAWSGPIIDVVRYGHESNLAVIFRSFVERQRSGLLLRAFTSVWQLAARKFNFFVHLPTLFVPLVPMLFFGVILFTTPKRGAFFHMRVLIVLSSIVTIFALSRSFQPFADYLITYFLGVLMLAVALVLMAIIERAAAFLLQVAGIQAKHGRLAICCLALVAVLFSAANHPEPGVSPKRNSCGLSRFAERFVASLNPQPGTLYAVTPDTFELRGFTVFFALQMLHRGAVLCFDDQWEHYVGRALSCSYQRESPYRSFVEEVPVELSLVAQPAQQRRLNDPQSPSKARRRNVQMSWVDSSGAPHSFEASGRSTRSP